ncbi:hypothetical protein ONZ45_g4657 [Pleurotus djamor]|nr:hypothetical protein ONZ45_g4657 [Pleurotus djamor]
MSPPTNTIDHIVHLTPPGSLNESVAHFEQLGFRVIQGGTHADGLTSNALVIFEDGFYLELINFVKPASEYPPGTPERQRRDSHPWAEASKQPGWVDYAFLGTGDAKDEANTISKIINGRSKLDGSNVEYLPEVAGGRMTPQGKTLKWLITGAAAKHGRGVLPFFCGDVTPREWRVPITQDHYDHPSTAKGIAHIMLLSSSPDDVDQLARQFTTIIGSPPQKNGDELSWSLETITTLHPTKLRLRVESSEEEQGSRVSGVLARIHEVGFWVERGKGKGPALSPYGRLVWVELEE